MIYNPEMLRLARQRNGFQQIEAAKRLGIEQPVLSRLENGLSEIKTEFVKKAAFVYDLPEAFFAQTDPVFGAPVSVHPMWRKKADVSGRELDIVVAEMNVRAMHLRRLFEGVSISNTSDLPRLDVEDYGTPQNVAAVLRAHWMLPPGPIKNLTALAEKAGAVVVHSAMGGATVSGVTFAVPGMPKLIALNSDQPADRMRFTLAHELGHLVMHRFPVPQMEEEANAFASSLLIPPSDLKPYILGRRIDLPLLASLKRQWKVSMQSLLMAITPVANLTPNQTQYLWKQISARGYRLREPPELDFPKEEPTIIDSVIGVHRDGLGYSIETLGQLLNEKSDKLPALYPSLRPPSPPQPKITILR
jgi:Zn-dependent peptidase ImmA (M78 family)